LKKILEIEYYLDKWLTEIDSAYIDILGNKIAIYFESGERYFFSKKYLYLVEEKGNNTKKRLKAKHNELLEMELLEGKGWEDIEI